MNGCLSPLDKVISEFRSKNPQAGIKQAYAHALGLYDGDDEKAKTFVRRWSNLAATSASFAKDVERIWPERKGY